MDPVSGSGSTSWRRGSAKICGPERSRERATIILGAVGRGPRSDKDCTSSMQNRSMFPYRRHGPKKRSKGGGGPMRKPHGPQKGLPNSARDLLPMLQPATKALAQMLAGRTQMSGQLEQARAVLAQAERLIADRVHNRLNPAEREEFFEQIARLRLTLADADSEAEFRAAEQQAPARPAPPPIAQERLKEMAMALATPEGRRRSSPGGGDDFGPPGPPAAPEDRPGPSAGPEAAGPTSDPRQKAARTCRRRRPRIEGRKRRRPSRPPTARAGCWRSTGPDASNSPRMRRSIHRGPCP